ncbi:MAG: dihydropteroate synthase [Verrucomicrobia bacterium]|nr:dihydropteroate synthase [Verrucomicrobiota bacterium]
MSESCEWMVRGGSVSVGTEPIVMGILNVTPDSFSDGGLYYDTGKSVERALIMEGLGAGIIDIGGESTRPGSHPVSVDEEMRRVLPVIRRLTGQSGVLISVDTRKSVVAEAALDAGAHIINDIEAGRLDPGMWQKVVKYGAGYVAMHMQGSPLTMQNHPDYQDVVSEVLEYFNDLLSQFQRVGIQRRQVVLDVGIGFGKTLEHNLDLMRNLAAFHQFGCPQLLGVSRKSLFDKMFQLGVQDRLVPSLTGCLWGYTQGVQIFRVHDVRETVLALSTWRQMTQ